MLVSHRHRFIFVHPYKTAGMSVRRALDPYAEGRARRWVAKYARRLGLPAPATPPFHLSAREIRARLGAEVFDAYFTFAFVRNPWDWQVSLYHYMRARRDHRQYEMVRAFSGFDAYIRWRVAEEVRLQKAFLSDEAGRMIVDFVGRVETIDDDFARVCETIGLPPLRLPHRNRSRHRNYRGYYTNETRELVARAFTQDIEMFGYGFDGPVTAGPVPIHRSIPEGTPGERAPSARGT